MTITRIQYNQIVSSNDSVLLLGPRGVGKSWLISNYLDDREKKLPNHSLRFNLLQSEVLRSLALDPALFRAQVIAATKNISQQLIVFVDEIQLLPGILNEVHLLIESLHEKVRFILTGSSARKLKGKGVNLLAGRAPTLSLHPLTSKEVEIDLHLALQFGTLPKAFLSPEAPNAFLNSYVDTYLREEIKQEALVRKYDAFIRFLDLAAQLNGTNINFSKLSRQCGVASSTIEGYYSILEDTLLVHRLNGWSHSVKKQIVIGPRYYFFDCGILNAINRELHLPTGGSTGRFGKLFETYMVLEALRYNDYHALNYRLHYWRTNTGMEVDLVLSRSQYEEPIAVEIKSSRSPDFSDLQGLESFRAEYPKARTVCLCMCDKPYTKDKIEYLPWQRFEEIFS